MEMVWFALVRQLLDSRELQDGCLPGYLWEGCTLCDSHSTKKMPGRKPPGKGKMNGKTASQSLPSGQRTAIKRESGHGQPFYNP